MITHLALDGVLEGALGLGIDIVDTAAGIAGDMAGGRLRQRVASLDGLPARSSGGRPISVDSETPLGSTKFGPGDILVLPGPSAASEARIDELLARPDAMQAVENIRRAADSGATVAASCSASFVLAASGLLSGRAATTTWWLAPLFARRFPDVALHTDRMVVDCGEILTAGAAFAHADLLLTLVARLGGGALAEQVAHYLVLDARMSQSRYMVLEHLRATDPVLRAVQQQVHANLHRQLSLDELASAAAVSPRTLARRIRDRLGVSPTEYVHRLRVGQAATLLTTTRKPVDVIAGEVGYADPAAFRRIYRRHTGETPTVTRTRAAESTQHHPRRDAHPGFG
ncbi:helix-turn-helix domain-containing protein [Nocardia sp. NEAU-G5]|uniref:Helix-turn-helix domain-containing protein n=1 Tax=Nocardia albiluteola TaxID=2842303 RepID=A0ABS6AVP9_9NOCA|nr:helix-turn-helix domain-containing protein [Nocardia albiluteola]MBU3061045.1 helix-turn-helix domain-containing protein [Nocardia albiluteola]